MTIMSSSPPLPTAARRYFSVIVGDGCNARCPFCIAPARLKRATEPLPVDRLRAASTYALAQGAAVASLSGGGEPLLFGLRQRDAYQAVLNTLTAYPKRDLHSNYSIDPLGHKLDAYPAFTDVTVSLLADEQTNRAYMGYTRYEITRRLIARDAGRARFRLSAALGSDWARGPEDLDAYLRFARGLGAVAVTFRELQPPAHDVAARAWIAERHLPGAQAAQWLAERWPVSRTTVRGADVYDADGLQVCVYRYARQDDEPDRDFLFFRPHTLTGRYGLFCDYDDDTTEIDLPC